METYTLINTVKYGFQQTISWSKNDNGEALDLDNTIGFKFITIKVQMTPEDRKELEEQDVITMHDLMNFDYEIDEVCAGEYEWAIGGDISDEERDQIMEELEEHDWDPEVLGWTNEGDSGYDLVDGGLEFMDN